MHGACLRPQVARLLGESHLGAGREVLESAAEDAVAMEPDQAPILGLDPARAMLGVELADPAVGRLVVGLHIATPLALVVLELAPGGFECIAQRDIGVLMGVVGRMRMSDRDLLIGESDIDVEIVRRSLVLVMRRGLGDDMTMHDVCAELIEPRGELANASFKCRRGVHMAERNL